MTDKNLVEVGHGGPILIEKGGTVTVARIADEPIRIGAFTFEFAKPIRVGAFTYDGGSELSLLDLRVVEIRLGLETLFHCVGGLAATCVHYGNAFLFGRLWTPSTQLMVKLVNTGPDDVHFRLFVERER